MEKKGLRKDIKESQIVNFRMEKDKKYIKNSIDVLNSRIERGEERIYDLKLFSLKNRDENIFD